MSWFDKHSKGGLYLNSQFCSILISNILFLYQIVVAVNQQCRKEVPFSEVEPSETAYLILLSIYIKLI